MDFGILSLVPPILTIVLALVTKEILMSLFIGTFVGCMIYAVGNPLTAMETFIQIVIDSLADPWSIEVIVVLCLMGGLIGLMIRSGGSAAFGKLLGKKIKTKKGAMRMTWLIGICIFFDDYFNALANGAIMRQVNDGYGISREKTSYIIDSTAVGVTLLAPISTWVAFTCGLMGESFEKLNMDTDAFTAFCQCIPFNFYCWLSIIMVFVVASFQLDFGPMAKCERRTQLTGKLCDQTFGGGDAETDDYAEITPSEKGKADGLLVPIIMLVVLAFIFLLYTGGFFSNHDMIQTLNDMDGMLALTYSSGVTVVFAIIYYKIRGVSSISSSIASFVVGVKALMFVFILIVFAWAIGAVGDMLGTADYMATLFVGHIPGWIVPAMLFAFSCFMTFSTGAGWGTYGIMIPLGIPLAVAMDISVFPCVAGIIGGAAFGTHCSPLADTAILSSASSNVRHTDHIRTQIPYSVCCAACAFIGFIVAGFTGGWVLPILVTVACFIVVIFFLNKLFGHANDPVEVNEEPAAAGD